MNLQWDILINDDARFPRLLFFAEFSDDRFRYGINEHMQYCLYFNFDSDRRNVPLEPVIKENLSLEETVEDGKAALVLTLLNESAKNLFGDLIVSIVTQVRKTGRSSAKSRFVELCNEWAELFEPLHGQLTKAELQGIFAELSFLKHLLLSSRHAYNDILSAWKGPFGKGHDFELEQNHFEIKGIAEHKAFVHISSEHQLDSMGCQTLLLCVVEFAGYADVQISVKDLIDEIIDKLRSVTNVNMTLFWTALGKAGLSYTSVGKYDGYRFSIKKTTHFKCSDLDFPALKRSEIDDSIVNVRYDLALSSLRDFEINDITSLI